MTKTEIVSALKLANQAPYTAQRPSGCGRAYVVISVEFPRKGRKAALQMWEDACKEAGLRWFPEIHGCGGRGIYIGYDNCDGLALAKSEAFAASLKASGIPCYADAAED